MADQQAVVEERATHRLAEAELDALRDHAAELLLEAAKDRVRRYDPAANGRPEAEIQGEEHARMLGAAEVYGPLKREELRFSRAKGLPDPAEYVEIAFSEEAMTWLRAERNDIAGMLAQQRGTIEVGEYEGGNGTPRDTFLLWILDGIFGAETGAEARGFSADPEVAAIEREAVKELADVARRYVSKLPMVGSPWRDSLIGVSDLDSVDRIAEMDARLDEGKEGDR